MHVASCIYALLPVAEFRITISSNYNTFHLNPLRHAPLDIILTIDQLNDFSDGRSEFAFLLV